MGGMRAPLPVIVVTSKDYLWAMKAFAYLFNIFWSELQPVIVFTDVIAREPLRHNFTFRTINNGRPLPKERWSDGLIHGLNLIPNSHFVLMLEDYWLVRTVDHRGIETLADFAQMNSDILRIDLTDDRQFNGDARDIGSFGHYDLVETPYQSPYQMSFQAAIWNRTLLLEILQRNKTPWEVEMHTQPPESMRVIGTKQSPLRYINAFKGGDPHSALNLGAIPAEHREYMERKKWLIQQKV